MDTIGDFLSQIRNAGMARKLEISAPLSKFRIDLAKLLAKLGFVGEIKTKKISKAKKKIIIKLRYDKQGNFLINKIQGVSTPGCRRYAKASEIPWVLGGAGYVILSTSQGLMIGKEARDKNLGGEIICKIY